jgi:glutathione peroxidase
MKTVSTLLFMSVFSVLFGKVSTDKPDAAPASDFYSLSFTSIDGKEIDFSSYKGKKILIVNTASKCGFTPQFAGLEQLHQKYKDKLVIIGFPSNEFGGQDPGSNAEIRFFCQKNYGVSFLMAEKSSVKGENKNIVYRWLTDKSQNGWNEQEPTWNFCKYLIDENGQLRSFFLSRIEPGSNEITDLIEK